MAFSDFLKDTVTIKEKSKSLDSFGHKKNVYSTKDTNVLCRIIPVDINLIEDLGGIAEDARYRIQFKSSANVSINDRVDDGTDVFEIKEIFKRYTQDTLHHLECYAKKL